MDQHPESHAAAPQSAQPAGEEDELQIVSFRVEDEEFGLDILRVQEIIRCQQITRVPHSSGFVDGVINLRGKIIPVIGLRKRFGMTPQPVGSQTRIVVLESRGTVLGFIVDSVRELVRIPASVVATPPRFGKLEREYVSGVAKLQDRLLLLLDIERLIDGQDSQPAAR